MRARLFFLALIAVISLANPVRALQQVKSLYTALDLASCSSLEGVEASEPGKLCAGLAGYPIYLFERDGKTFLSAGPDAASTKAARQTLAVENSVFGGGMRPTIEWRFIIRDDRPVPYAMIVRYFTTSSAGDGEVLVVTRISEREACHVAYVDALANGEPLVLARKIADDVARRFECAKEPSVMGARGRSPM